MRRRKRRGDATGSILLEELARGEVRWTAITSDAGMGRTALLENLDWHLATLFCSIPQRR